MRFRLTRSRPFKSQKWSILILFSIITLFYLLSIPAKEPPKGDIVTVAKHYLGTPYRYGGSTPDGFDCSGYILFLFQKFGKDLPRTADQQATVGKQVNMGDLKPGDIIFFATTDEPTISHTGLYIGNWLFIHASSSAKKVIISNLSEPYWQKSFRGARQILP